MHPPASAFCALIAPLLYSPTQVTATVDGGLFPGATISISSGPAQSAVPFPVQLAGPVTPIPVTITSADGSAQATYTITVTRASLPSLASLVLVTADLSPAFSPGTYAYSSSLSSADTTFSVVAAVNNETTLPTMLLNGQQVQSGASVLFQAEQGSVVSVNITVFSNLDPTVNATYTVSVVSGGGRLPLPSLIYLDVRGDTLSPAFSPSVFGYSATHPPTHDVVVTATPYPLVPVLSMTINGQLAQPSVPLPLNLPYGYNNVTVQLNGKYGSVVYYVVLFIPDPPRLVFLSSSVGYVVPQARAAHVPHREKESREANPTPVSSPLAPPLLPLILQDTMP